MTPLRALAIAFWLFCMISCCVFLYNDYVAAPEASSALEASANPHRSGGGGGECPLGFSGMYIHIRYCVA